MRRTDAGFTLIELLIVVVIIGILAAVAVPKFATTKDAAKLAAIKADVHNAMIAEEAYFSDYKTYGSLAQLRNAKYFELTTGNTMAVAKNTGAYTITSTNTSISQGITKCSVHVGAGVASTVDSRITCP